MKRSVWKKPNPRLPLRRAALEFVTGRDGRVQRREGCGGMGHCLHSSNGLQNREGHGLNTRFHGFNARRSYRNHLLQSCRIAYTSLAHARRNANGIEKEAESIESKNGETGVSSGKGTSGESSKSNFDYSLSHCESTCLISLKRCVLLAPK